MGVQRCSSVWRIKWGLVELGKTGPSMIKHFAGSLVAFLAVTRARPMSEGGNFDSHPVNLILVSPLRIISLPF